MEFTKNEITVIKKALSTQRVADETHLYHLEIETDRESMAVTQILQLRKILITDLLKRLE